MPASSWAVLDGWPSFLGTPEQTLYVRRMVLYGKGSQSWGKYLVVSFFLVHENHDCVNYEMNPIKIVYVETFKN